MTPAPIDRPNTIPWPPILYVGAIIGSVGAQVLAPLAYPDWMRAPLAAIGLATLVAGVLIDVAAIRTLARHATTVMPHRASAALVTNGPYAISRNPIYLGNTLALVGLALVFEMPWFLVAAPVVAVLVTMLAIRREEAHLAARFPDSWAAYASRVRRWI